ncbi:glycosyltransferase involved in cell wall biosynthesis [Chitinivorax tropicus]|uniref:Glycosyltransferase involved in cell wall biosynthesis n=1 Tax=Chitinivorax tropicus TaxID=714531 RepID=A0A840MI42_9PROT|nr:glycosyltransferase [Chitinivorax tropicus]MBB5018318.1 glycosyltransferase involved in cell wall biosynthesis [Chitinivorax tropicus]
MSRRVLLIAYHYPPLRGSSGIQRALRFSQYLTEFGWEPIVLTAHPRAYPDKSDDLMVDVPPGVIVERAFALDTSRHLSLAGRYPRAFALPDRWVTWWLGAVPAGMRLIKRYQPAAIWSTYPIATAHKIGATLQARTGLPWIADFRDPMAQDGYPEDPTVWNAFKQLEMRAFKQCRFATFTSPGAIQTYRETYPDLPGNKLVLLENGYDEEVFARAAGQPVTPADKGGRRILLHSGIVYSMERDPTQLFMALGQLKRAGEPLISQLLIRLRATGNDARLQEMAAREGITDLIELAPPIPYADALSEMLNTDGLLVLQGASCNGQIPAKAYEYLRARRPILALTDPVGDTADVIRRAGINTIAPLDNVDAIKAALRQFMSLLVADQAPYASEAAIQAASRRGRTEQFARLLDAATQVS